MIIIDYSYLSMQKRFKSEADTIIIGRPSDEHAVDLDLTPDATVSRHHARLIYENGDYWLEDLSSRSGTWVNSQKITLKPAGTGDCITLGQTNLTVQQIEAKSPPPANGLDTQQVNIKDGVLTARCGPASNPQICCWPKPRRDHQRYSPPPGCLLRSGHGPEQHGNC